MNKLHHIRTDLPPLNTTLIRDRESYPDFEITHASEIDRHLREIIALKDTSDPVFSIYLDLTSEDLERDIRRMVAGLAHGLDEESLYWLFQAEVCILDLIGNRLRDEHRGLSLHFRGGDKPWIKAIAFHVPVASWACADRHPNLVPLIEMRDTYDRYIVLISDESHARILEVVVGSVTREAWLSRPSLRKKVGREWAREHYRNYNEDRGRKFILEKVNMVTSLMSKGKYNHLILAGDPERVKAIEAALPEWARQQIVDVCELDLEDKRERIVRKTIHSFIEQEAFESRSALERLNQLILSGGHHATVGLDECELALAQELVETLVITRSVSQSTGTVRVFRHRTMDGNYLTIEKRRQRLIHEAVEKGVRIEFVDRESFLDDFCGVGAILRHDRDDLLNRKQRSLNVA